ncbi:response regulator transcription factor [Nocardioides sp. HDW12B]|uniref:response regulator transcription factor n=1 Tax=Nocardioides sp. HDW12B TaxID=2714939 RepID=UPI00140F1AEB|nr:response regulator transcription factor [Nocardioides sp. HDW12B]QIK65261.1 response regulator transcription factor [Nocardioides sp. HDW12B]
MSPSTGTALAEPPVPEQRRDHDTAPQAVVRVAVRDDHQQVGERLRRVLAPYTDRAVVMHSAQADVSELVLALSTQDLLALLASVEASGPRLADDRAGDPADDWAAGVRRSDHASALSPREEQVVTLVAAGLPNHEIAVRLYLTQNTLKSYIRSAYRKMGVRTRAQAVAWAFSHGLAPSPPGAPGVS